VISKNGICAKKTILAARNMLECIYGDTIVYLMRVSDAFVVVVVERFELNQYSHICEREKSRG